MNLVTIALKSIRQRMLASSLTALSVALGVMLMVSVLVIFGIVERVFSQRSVAYDLVVGPKGSDLQLVLSTIYRISPPIENLPYKYYLQLKNDEEIAEAVPIALGDTTEEGGFPIVGTNLLYFELPYAPDREFRIRGHLFRKPFDSVIGYEVARKNGWDIGSQFTMQHGGAEGHVHDEKFTVVGVLGRTGTPNDKSVFVHLNGFYAISGHDTPLEEALQKDLEFFGPNEDNAALGNPDHPLWKAVAEDDHDEHGHGAHDHAHHDHAHHATPDVQKEVTSILINMRRPPGEDRYSASLAPAMFAAKLRSGLKAQAVNPILPMQTLMETFVEPLRLLLGVLTGLIIIVSGVGIFVSIYNSMADRRREIAVMRALGARRATVFSIILAEAVILCFGGGIAGLLLGHGLVFLAAPIVEAYSGLLIDPFAFEMLELLLLPALILLASLVGMIPGMTAYRTDVAKTLAE